MSVPAKRSNWLPSSKSESSSKTKSKTGGRIKWGFGVLFGIFLLAQALPLWYWSIEPAPFDVIDEAIKRAEVDDPKKLVNGYIFSNTLAKIAETLMNKRGGYLSNDVTPPSIFMDNMPNWEFGALVMLRDASTALRNHFARHQTQSKENFNLSRAEPYFYFENDSWIIPSTEGEYGKGIKHLLGYLEDLQHQTNPSAHFYSRADNLSQYLQIVEKRLGSLSHRLSASSVQKHQYSQDAERMITTSTAWLDVDDIFFEARGAMWALLHIFRAIEVDFDATIRNKAALATLRQIIHEFEDSQGALLSPMVLNGGGFSVFANYSLTMANFITRANAAMLDLKDLMMRG